MGWERKLEGLTFSLVLRKLCRMSDSLNRGLEALEPVILDRWIETGSSRFLRKPSLALRLMYESQRR